MTCWNNAQNLYWGRELNLYNQSQRLRVLKLLLLCQNWCNHHYTVNLIMCEHFQCPVIVHSFFTPGNNAPIIYLLSNVIFDILSTYIQKFIFLLHMPKETNKSWDSVHFYQVSKNGVAVEMFIPFSIISTVLYSTYNKLIVSNCTCIR